MGELNNWGSVVDLLDNSATGRTANFCIREGQGIKRITAIKVGWTNTPASATQIKFARVTVVAGAITALRNNAYIESFDIAWPALMANFARKILLDVFFEPDNGGVIDILLPGQFIDSEANEPITVIQFPAYFAGDSVGSPTAHYANLNVFGQVILPSQATKEIEALKKLTYR